MIEFTGCALMGIISLTFIAMLIDELRTNYKIRKDLEGDNKMDEYMEAKSHPISSCAELSKYFIGRHEIVPVYLTPQFEKEFNAKMYQLENLQQTPKELIGYIDDLENEVNKFERQQSNYIKYLKNLATQNEVSSDFAVGCKVAYGMALKRYIEMKDEIKGE